MATLRIKDRVRSLTLRFEGVDKRWVCTELKLL
ncbi:MAG: Rv3235 family protein [Actinomycetota bacterium]|nr:Rv3235 family protein [Actinomycetota bacterium]